MSKIRIVTDSNSGILQSQAKEFGIYVIPMPFTINGEEYLEEITISQEEFYNHLASGADVKTSQPSQYYLEELWDQELNEYDEILYIPMSSGLSATCKNAKNYAEKYQGKVQVVDNLGISVTQKESVFRAIELVKQGKNAKEIKELLEQSKKVASIYITMGVLKYLKKGGRITPAAALLGDLLKLKPILSSRGGSFEKFAVAMSMIQAKKKILQQIKKELETEFLQEYEQGNICVSVAHTQNEQEAQKFKEEIQKEFPNLEFHFVDPLALSVSCHIGPGALAVAICKKQSSC
ncbi:MAG: DegV family protein [Clostridia bacterium]|nr:DegV family protein [Clostridia bacterium]